MEKKEKARLDTKFMFNEVGFLITKIILPLIIFVVAIIMIILGSKGNILIFFSGLLAAFLSLIYLIYFLISRMTKTLKEKEMLKKQSSIYYSQSKTSLRIGLIIFLVIIFILFATVTIYGKESIVFKSIMTILDIGILIAILYSIKKSKN